MTNSWVVKLRLADSDGAVLVNVTSKDSSSELDLDLLATDGDAAFRGKVRTRSLSKLRAKHYDGSAEEWTSIIKYGLFGKKSSQLDTAVKDSLELQCSISGKDPNSVLSITFRTLVQDITQQLGTIELPQTEDTDDVDLFGWASQLADRRDELEGEAMEQQRRSGAEAKNMDAIQKQLDELTQAKADHERELMTKFAMLLNEKKFELRRLQRVLETAKVDPKQLKALKESEQASGKRGQKRKPRRSDQANEEDESDAFDNMDVDDKAEEGGSGPGDQTTDSENTENDGDEDLDQPVTSQAEARSSPQSKAQSKAKAPKEMPAPRELPFTRQREQGHNTRSHKDNSSDPPAAAHDDEEEETASEDDEL